MKTSEYLCGNRYPGRLIAAGVTPSGKLVYAYAIMGRSQNSRNRVFRLKGEELYTEPYDAGKVQDPSLIIYPAILKAGNTTIVTNGDQTLDIRRALLSGKSAESVLEARTYEPDAPNYTPRISLVVGKDDFEFSILRRREDGSCDRSYWKLPKKAGMIYMIHTYDGDGNPLPAFSGSPKVLESEDSYAPVLWKSLDHENRISLYVREGDDIRLYNAREEENEN